MAREEEGGQAPETVDEKELDRNPVSDESRDLLR